jgi:hypothetical protein
MRFAANSLRLHDVGSLCRAAPPDGGADRGAAERSLAFLKLGQDSQQSNRLLEDPSVALRCVGPWAVQIAPCGLRLLGFELGAKFRNYELLNIANIPGPITTAVALFS